MSQMEVEGRKVLEFSPLSPKVFRKGGEVKVQLVVKNCESIVFKIFKIDTFEYYKAYGRKLDAEESVEGKTPFMQVREHVGGY